MGSDGAGKILVVDDIPENVRLLEAVLVPLPMLEVTIITGSTLVSSSSRSAWQTACHLFLA